MNMLRGIVREEDGLFEAQLLEVDLAVTASSVDEIMKEIEHSLVVEYLAARDLGITPFANLARKAPHPFQVFWSACAADGTKLRTLNVPNEVLDALAIAIHSPGKPRFALQEYRLKAA